MHIPVMLDEVLSLFSRDKLHYFFDGTLGGGGHAEAILTAHPELKKYLGCDKDVSAFERVKHRLERWREKVLLVHGSFSEIQSHSKRANIPFFDGILFDVGVSSFQLEESERGFSFSKEGPLDMRMDNSSELSAEIVVNEFSEKKLGEIIHQLGEEPRWKKIVKAIVETRRRKRITTTSELKTLIEKIVPRHHRKIHPATLTFQALRIFVNQELTQLEEGIKGAFSLLNKGGVLVVISFHSLEDRIVKNLFRNQGLEENFEKITKKPLRPQRAEIFRNPRSRSAKLRAIRKCS